MEVWKFDKKSGIGYDIDLLERKKSKTKRKDLIDKYDTQINKLRNLL